MAIQQRPWAVSHAVQVWVPNEREGQILGGTQTHADATTDTCKPLRTYALRHGLGWVVRQETELLYQRTTYTRPRDRIGAFYPDCLVAIGVQDPIDAPYDLTRIGMPPVLVIEIISRRTWRRDVGLKVQAYAQMGIYEYVTFDPRPRKNLELRGYHLAGPGQYQAIVQDAEGGLWLSSIDLRVIGERRPDLWPDAKLRFSTRTGEKLLHTDEEAARRLEAEAQRQEAEQTAALEQARRHEAEARAARLQALLAEHGLSADEAE
jgi:Uma2 family endonuclease